MRKQEAETAQIDLMDRNSIDLIVLARYMQILSPAFVERLSASNHLGIGTW
jgi:formyltetrahydrofolate deformylase